MLFRESTMTMLSFETVLSTDDLSRPLRFFSFGMSDKNILLEKSHFPYYNDRILELKGHLCSIHPLLGLKTVRQLISPLNFLPGVPCSNKP